MILYELLTARHPFPPPPAGVKLQEARPLLLEQRRAGARPVRSHNPEVDHGLAELVDRCLAFAPADRPASAQAARALLEKRVGATRAVRRALLGRRSLALAVLLPLLLSGGMLWHALTARPETPAIAADPYALGMAAYGRGDYAEARRHLDEHVYAHEQDPRGWFQRGVVSLKLKQYDLALTDFATADRLRPDGLTKACLGYALHGNQQRKEARYCFEQAVKFGYLRAEALNNLGFLNLQEGGAHQSTGEPQRGAQACARVAGCLSQPGPRLPQGRDVAAGG